MIPSPTTRPRSSGFTLTELLVVIAIIGVLAAIILPTVSAVRRAANLAKCKANLHTVGIAILQYVQDNKQVFPGPMATARVLPSYKTFGSSRSQLAEFIGPYLGLTELTDNKYHNADALICPAWWAAAGAPVPAKNDLNALWGVVGEDSVFGVRSNGVIKRRVPQNINDLGGYLARTGVITEFDTMVHTAAALPPWHGNVRNTLYADGHVQSASVDIIIKNENPLYRFDPPK